MSVTARTAGFTTQVGIPGERAVSRSQLVGITDRVGTVHSVFASACNLAFGGLLVAVHDAARSHTPTSIRVRVPGLASWAPTARPGEPVIQRDGWLGFGSHLLKVSDLDVWQPTPIALSVESPVRQAHLAHQLTVLEDFRVHRSTPMDPRIDRAARAITQALTAVRGLSNTNMAQDPQTEIDYAVKRLVGFGPGLTPAGDDILVGLLAVLSSVEASADRPHSGPPFPSPGDRLRAAINLYLSRTNDISSHYLGLAAAGHFGESIDLLLGALATGQSDHLLLARATAVISIGASSGADTLRGVAAGLAVVLADAPHLISKENMA